MWTSIKNILHPDDITEAISLGKNTSSRYHSGGTYLVAERNPNIDTLIHILPFLGTEIIKSDSFLTIDAGVTLQQLLETHTDQHTSCLKNSIKYSCTSKNIRNQRTMGGEIARDRKGSDLLSMLHAMNAELTVFSPERKIISIAEWSGKGIITAIHVANGRLLTNGIERFALIPSAPSIVTVAASAFENKVTIVVSSMCKARLTINEWVSKISKARIQSISDKAAQKFKADHYGSIEFKKHLTRIGIERVLCKLNITY